MGVAVLDRIQHHEGAGFGLDGVLHETVPVRRRLREDALEALAVVVIADQQVAGHFQVGENLLHRAVGGLAAVVGEVAGQDHEIRVAVDPVHAIDDGGEARRRLQCAQAVAGRNQVSVGDMDELHGVGPESGIGVPSITRR